MIYFVCKVRKTLSCQKATGLYLAVTTNRAESRKIP